MEAAIVAKVFRSDWLARFSDTGPENFPLAPILARAYDWACKAGMSVLGGIMTPPDKQS